MLGRQSELAGHYAGPGAAWSARKYAERRRAFNAKQKKFLCGFYETDSSACLCATSWVKLYLTNDGGATHELRLTRIMAYKSAAIYTYRLEVDPCDGWEIRRIYYISALDDGDAYRQACDKVGTHTVEGFGKLLRVEQPTPSPPPLAAGASSDFMTMAEAKAFLKADEKTIRKMIQEGRLQNYRLDGSRGRIRIRRSELVEAMRAVENSEDPRVISAKILDAITGKRGNK